MAVPPPADPPGPQPPQPRQPEQFRPPAPGRPPTRSPGSPNPIDRALLSGARHPAGPTIAPDPDYSPTRADRPTPKQAPRPYPRPTADPRTDASTAGPRAEAGATSPRAEAGATSPRAEAGATSPRAEAGATGPRAEAGATSPRADSGGHGLRFRPVVHVDDMAASVAFYRRLGAEIVHGSPDGDWVLIQVGTTQVDLITRPPRADQGECTVELNFAAEEPLERLRDRLSGPDRGTGDGFSAGDPMADFAVHPHLGELLEVRTPDGLLIKISQLDPDL